MKNQKDLGKLHSSPSVRTTWHPSLENPSPRVPFQHVLLVREVAQLRELVAWGGVRKSLSSLELIIAGGGGGGRVVTQACSRGRGGDGKGLCEVG
ncbi:hypothetical protein DVH24_035323 [Malus domestica]|uniref:Uncharacterized protein n=1 Tax=Malus domestica TaxID=3750 RepID=A0A498J457_MALDO|nr:hypothetical protein DVH24_035323 [Malus domestica]